MTLHSATESSTAGEALLFPVSQVSCTDPTAPPAAGSGPRHNPGRGAGRRRRQGSVERPSRRPLRRKSSPVDRRGLALRPAHRPTERRPPRIHNKERGWSDGAERPADRPCRPRADAPIASRRSCRRRSLRDHNRPSEPRRPPSNGRQAARGSRLAARRPPLRLAARQAEKLQSSTGAGGETARTAPLGCRRVTERGGQRTVFHPSSVGNVTHVQRIHRTAAGGVLDTCDLITGGGWRDLSGACMCVGGGSEARSSSGADLSPFAARSAGAVEYPARRRRRRCCCRRRRRRPPPRSSRSGVDNPFGPLAPRWPTTWPHEPARRHILGQRRLRPAVASSAAALAQPQSTSGRHGASAGGWNVLRSCRSTALLLSCCTAPGVSGDH